MRQTPKGIAKLDLTKYGLSHLVDKEIHTLQDYEIDKLVHAFAAENIAPAIYGPPLTPYNVQRLLSLSYCRRCGKCCIPNPIDPDHPGVMVYEQDLKLIAKNSKYSYNSLKKKAPINKDPSLPRRRYLPLPCMFYDKKKHECQIYNIRPFICRTFPVSDLPVPIGISIAVRCDYGKDIYKAVIDHMRKGTFRQLLEE